jgi:hypothetical protein
MPRCRSSRCREDPEPERRRRRIQEKDGKRVKETLWPSLQSKDKGDKSGWKQKEVLDVQDCHQSSR